MFFVKPFGSFLKNSDILEFSPLLLHSVFVIVLVFITILPVPTAFIHRIIHTICIISISVVSVIIVIPIHINIIISVIIRIVCRISTFLCCSTLFHTAAKSTTNILLNKFFFIQISLLVNKTVRLFHCSF